MGSAVSMLCYVFPLFLPCSLTTFINTSFSKLTDCLSCFPLGRVLDVTVDLTYQSQASPPGVCVLFVLNLLVCVGLFHRIRTKQKQRDAAVLVIFCELI